MQYVGSKNRLKKELVPIIQNYITDDTRGYLEPFVGGANMIDKIKCDKKIGLDIHKELIALLKYVQDLDNVLPQHISEKKYNEVKISYKIKDGKYEDWYYGLVGFCGSFSSRFFNTYARGNDNRDRQGEAIRNIEKQRINLKNICFGNMSFLDIPKDSLRGYVIYCDPPYRSSEHYYQSGKDGFNYEEFDSWCVEMSRDNTVLISEYVMPEDKFECIWKKDIKVGNSPAHKVHSKRTEKLFIVKNTESEDK